LTAAIRRDPAPARNLGQLLPRNEQLVRAGDEEDGGQKSGNDPQSGVMRFLRFLLQGLGTIAGGNGRSNRFTYIDEKT
jgi:hypothetical protein